MPETTQQTAAAPQGVSSALQAITQMAVFAALVAVLGQLIVPIGPVPITLGTLGVVLSGAILGPWRGAGAMVLLNLMAVAGMPVLAQGSGGLGAYAGPTGGFVIAYILVAFFTGLIVQYSWPLRWWRTGLGVVVGSFPAMYSLGLPVMAWNLGITLQEAAMTALVFIPGDIAKGVFAVLVTHTLAKGYPQPFTYARRRGRLRAPQS